MMTPLPKDLADQLRVWVREAIMCGVETVDIESAVWDTINEEEARQLEIANPGKCVTK